MSVILRPFYTYFCPLFCFVLYFFFFAYYLTFFVIIKLFCQERRISYGIIVTCVSLFLFIVTNISFLKVVFVHPGSPEKNWSDSFQKKKSQNAEEEIESEDAETKELDFCIHCNVYKPPRCHHCTACDMCVLKMDHHCGVVNNCIGFNNYKFFLLYIFYLILNGIWGLGTLLEIGWSYLNSRGSSKEYHTWWDYLLIPLGFMGLFIAFSMLLFFGYHIYLIIIGKTTLENMKRLNWSEFDQGIWKNIVNVCGFPLLWIVPTRWTVPGNGYVFKSRKFPVKEEE